MGGVYNFLFYEKGRCPRFECKICKRRHFCKQDVELHFEKEHGDREIGDTYQE